MRRAWFINSWIHKYEVATNKLVTLKAQRCSLAATMSKPVC